MAKKHKQILKLLMLPSKDKTIGECPMVWVTPDEMDRWCCKGFKHIKKVRRDEYK